MSEELKEGANAASGFLVTVKGILFASGIAGIGAGFTRALSVKGLHKRIDKIESEQTTEATKNEAFRDKFSNDMGELKGMMRVLIGNKGNETRPS